MIFNIVIFIWVIVVLVRHTRGTAARKKESVSKKTIIRLMISVSGVMFLFGLTWLFAILTFSVTGLRQAFQILFTIFNSFQGFFIFVFFCVFNKEVLESWKELLSCGKYKSKLLHPSQAKYISTAMANKLKPGTTASGLTVSSREKYASGSSVFDYESATLEKRNAYEKAPSETTQKVNLGTSSIVENPVAEDGGLTEVSPELIKPMIVPVIRVEQTDSVSGDAQNGRTAGSSGENGKKKEMALSLKARIKRYTTKKASKHHEEDAEVDFISNDSSQDSSGENNTTTQF